MKTINRACYNNVRNVFSNLNFKIHSKDDSTMNCKEIFFNDKKLFEIDLLSIRIVKKSQFQINFHDIEQIKIKMEKTKMFMTIELKDKDLISNLEVKL